MTKIDHHTAQNRAARTLGQVPVGTLVDVLAVLIIISIYLLDVDDGVCGRLVDAGG